MAPGGVQRFWKALQSEVCISAAGEKLLLELQDGVYFMGDELLSHSRMFVRSSYQTLYARIQELRDMKLRRFVVTGAPGAMSIRSHAWVLGSRIGLLRERTLLCRGFRHSWHRQELLQVPADALANGRGQGEGYCRGGERSVGGCRAALN
jgi:hypothetical protein